MGRKPQIDEKLLFDLATIHCTIKEMAYILHCSEDHLYDHYSDVIEAAKAKGKSSLRRAQWIKAMEGNVPMLIWLGRHLLGQRDSVELVTNQPEVRKLLEFWETAKIADKKRADEQRKEWKNKALKAARNEVSRMTDEMGLTELPTPDETIELNPT